MSFDSVELIARPTNASATDSRLPGESDKARVSNGLSRNPYRSQRFCVSTMSMLANPPRATVINSNLISVYQLLPSAGS